MMNLLKFQYQPLPNLFQKHGARIIIGNFYENKASVIFCEAYELGMYGAKYVWIITGEFLESAIRSGDCL